MKKKLLRKMIRDYCYEYYEVDATSPSGLRLKKERPIHNERRSVGDVMGGRYNYWSVIIYKKRIQCHHIVYAMVLDDWTILFRGYASINDLAHLDSNRDNNDFWNLRLLPRAWNNQMRGAMIREGSQDSKYKGVHSHIDCDWAASSTLNGKKINLGTFATEKKAAKAYDNYVRANQSPVAYLNFPTKKERRLRFL